MTCSFKIKKEQFNIKQKVCNFVSSADYDKVLGKFRIIITPLDCYRNDAKDEIAPTYYYKEVEDGYIIEGEGYIITDDFDAAILRYEEQTREKWKDNPPIQWLKME